MFRKQCPKRCNNEARVYLGGNHCHCPGVSSGRYFTGAGHEADRGRGSALAEVWAVCGGGKYVAASAVSVGDCGTRMRVFQFAIWAVVGGCKLGGTCFSFSY